MSPRMCVLVLVCGVVCIGSAMLAARPVAAQRPASESSADTTDVVKRSWVVLPSLFYTPRTKIGGGGSVRFFPERLRSGRPSVIEASVIYTQRRQTIISLSPDIFFDGDRRRVFGSMLYFNFPDRFYGIGNDQPLRASESYTSRVVSGLVGGEQEVLPGFRVGLTAWVRRERLSDLEPEGVLAGGTLPGSEGNWVVGPGAYVRWDTRDDLFYPSRGAYARLSWMYFDPAFGGDFQFSRAGVDLRRFWSLGWDQILAVQLQGLAVAGGAPFQLYPEVGGSELLRGYAQGRYKDRLVLALQAEYRLWVYGPVGFALFGSAADVQPAVRHLLSDPFILSGGAGLRFLMNEQGVNFRVDYAWGRDGGALYISVGEAF
ncbi:MAG: BamA/TamA family outer membrane protein [Rhodothermales bacterium]|nr:BamA/TamA family outer membrane protein [Rhodothermales bacterium]